MLQPICLLTLSLFLGTANICWSKSLTLVDQKGHTAEMYLNDSDGFVNVLDDIKQFYHNPSEHALADVVELTLTVSNDQVFVSSRNNGSRNYNTPVNSHEKKDIHYILTKMARDNYAALWKAESSLKKAGDRLRHLHPFKFLETIFTDEELKACAHAIRDRNIKKIWNEFVDGTASTLQQEMSRHNIQPFVQNFAQTVKIDPNLIAPLIQAEKWEGLISALIDHIPRLNNPNRYNM